MLMFLSLDRDKPSTVAAKPPSAGSRGAVDPFPPFGPPGRAVFMPSRRSKEDDWSEDVCDQESI